MLLTGLMLFIAAANSAAAPIIETIDQIKPEVLRAACAQEAERHAPSAGVAETPRVHWRNNVARAGALPVSTTEFACVASGETIVDSSTTHEASNRLWMFAMHLTRKGLEVDQSVGWSDAVLRSN